MTIDIYSTVVYSLLVFTFLFCGVLRWCNLWKSLGKNIDELYPARRLVTAIYLVVCLQFPYLLHPHSPDTWLFIRCFWIIYIPVAASLAFKKFFSGGKERGKLRQSLVGGVPLALMLVLFVFACIGGDMLAQWEKAVLWVVAGMGVLLTAYLLYVTVWLGRQIYDYNHSRYSNEKDFPIRFASGIISLPLILVAVAWILFWLNERIGYVCLTAVIALLGAGILLVILHPQFEKNISGEESPQETEKILVEEIAKEEGAPAKPDGAAKEEELPDENSGSVLSKHARTDLAQRIRTVMQEQQLYLNPNLKIDDIAKLLHTNRTYIVIVFKECFNSSFYSYLNIRRMEHSFRYAAEHPGATQKEIAFNSGFGSFKTYSRVRKAYQDGELN